MSDSLEFRLLKYIVAVAETSNFTRAAERLFLAQPSLSKQIRDLEEELKFPLFDRSRDGVKITAAGEMVLAYARETLSAREDSSQWHAPFISERFHPYGLASPLS